MNSREHVIAQWQSWQYRRGIVSNEDERFDSTTFEVREKDTQSGAYRWTPVRSNCPKINSVVRKQFKSTTGGFAKETMWVKCAKWQPHSLSIYQHAVPSARNATLTLTPCSNPHLNSLRTVRSNSNLEISLAMECSIYCSIYQPFIAFIYYTCAKRNAESWA